MIRPTIWLPAATTNIFLHRTAAQSHGPTALKTSIYVPGLCPIYYLYLTAEYSSKAHLINAIPSLPYTSCMKL